MVLVNLKTSGKKVSPLRNCSIRLACRKVGDVGGPSLGRWHWAAKESKLRKGGGTS